MEELNTEIVEDPRQDVDPTKGMSAAESSSGVSKNVSSALSKLSRELSDDDLKATGARKMILNRIDDLETANRNLEGFREKFYDIDKNYAVLNERYELLKVDVAIKNVMTIVGSALLGFLPSLHSYKWHWLALVIVAIVSIILIVVPFIPLVKIKGKDVLK